MSELLEPTPQEIARHFTKFDPEESEIRQAQRPLILSRQQAEGSVQGCLIILIAVLGITSIGLVIAASQPEPLKPGEVRIEQNQEQEFKPSIEEKSEPLVDIKGAVSELGNYIDELLGEPKRPYGLK